MTIKFGHERNLSRNPARETKRAGSDPVTMVTVTQHEALKAELEKMRAEIAELRSLVADAPWFGPGPTKAPAAKRDRATYMREYRKRKS